MTTKKVQGKGTGRREADLFILLMVLVIITSYAGFLMGLQYSRLHPTTSGWCRSTVTVAHWQNGKIPSRLDIWVAENPIAASLQPTETYPTKVTPNKPFFFSVEPKQVEIIPIPPAFNCSEPADVDQLTVELSTLVPYKVDIYDCTEFSAALIANLTARGCSARMVKGWYVSTNSTNVTIRTMHNWVETPEFVVEATPSNARLLDSASYGAHYDKIQSFEWNVSEICGS